MTCGVTWPFNLSFARNSRCVYACPLDEGLRVCFEYRTTQQYAAILRGHEPKLCIEPKRGYIAGSYLDVNETCRLAPGTRQRAR